MKRVVIAVVGLVALAGVAGADDKALGKEGERYFRAGAKAYAAQSFAAAVANFEEAYRALGMPEIAFSLAQAYRRLYRVDPKPLHVQRAVELYRVYLDKVKTGGRVGDAADNLGEMERELDRLKLRGVAVREDRTERTRLGVNVSLGGDGGEAAALREVGDATGDAMKGVVVTVDGKQVEPFALIDVEPGEHAVAVTAEGYFPVEKKQRAVAGAPALVEIALQPRPAKVSIRTLAGAAVTVDGRRASTELALDAGRHLVAVAHRGRVPFERELVVVRGQELTLDAPLPMTGRRRAVPWVLGTAGALAAGAIASGTVAFVADGRASDLDARIARGNQPPSVRADFDAEVSRRNDFRTSGLVLGGSAIVLGAVGAFLYYFDHPPTRGRF
ncbi:MAG: carboxypeptidase regulatory-like domain-containing protein [Deltaproteobacteria bacterium]|nr:carboxypeptidase regulatory-like domain-containing protein [Deltaproteobacteria bacterium]